MKPGMKHFIALVPMGGDCKGRVAQHSVKCSGYKTAVEWAKGRFSDNTYPLIVEMPNDVDGLDIEKSSEFYFKVFEKYSQPQNKYISWWSFIEMYFEHVYSQMN